MDLKFTSYLRFSEQKASHVLKYANYFLDSRTEFLGIACAMVK